MTKMTLDDQAALARVIRGDNGNDCPAQAAVLRWLAKGGRTGGPAPNLAAVARELGLSRQSVNRAIRRLRDRGFLEVQERREPHPPLPVPDRVVRTFEVRVPSEAKQLHLPLGT